MKKNISILLATAFIFAFASCTSDADDSALGSVNEGCVASTVDYTEVQVPDNITRSNLDYNGSYLKFSWNKGDQLALFAYSSDGAITYENIVRYVLYDEPATGENTNTFKNDDFPMVDGNLYYAFSPYSAISTQSNLKSTTLDYSGQRQLVNYSSSNPSACTSHLGAYDYQVAMAQAQDNEVFLHFKHLGSILHFKMTMPAAGTFNKLEVRSSDNYDFQLKKTIDLTGGNENVVSNFNPKFDEPQNLNTTSDNYFTLLLGAEGQNGATDPGISVAKGEVLHAFVAIPKGTELKGKTMYAVLKHAGTSGKDYYCTFTGRDEYEAGVMYGYARDAVESSAVTENIEVYRNWQNGSTTSVTRSTGDPGTTETFDKPKYLNIYTCVDGVVQDVNPITTSDDDWTELPTKDGWKYKTLEVTSITTMPKDSLHVYAVASNVPASSLGISSVAKGATEKTVRDILFTSDSQTNLANTYAVAYSSKNFGLDDFSSGIYQVTAKLYHVAAKVDVNWDCPGTKVGSIVVSNLLSKGYLFRPTENTSISTGGYSYTLRESSYDQMYYGRAYFYAIQQKDSEGLFPLNLTIEGESARNIKLTPGAQTGYALCTSWFRTNIK